MTHSSSDAQVLVATAMKREAAALFELGAVVCGTRAPAGAALDARLRGGGVRLVVVAGVCGGLDPALRPGDVIFAERVLAAERDDLTPEQALLEAAQGALRERGMRFMASALLTVDAPLGPRAARDAAWEKNGAAGVDMETYDLASVAEARNVPWLAVRVVLDPTQDELPRSLRAWSGESDLDVALRALRRPSEWPAYVRLGRQWRVAAASMRRVVPVVVAAGAEVVATRADAGTRA